MFCRNSMERVSIIQTGRLGRLLHSLPALRILREQAPGARIVLYMREAFAQVMDFISYADKIYTLEDGGESADGNGLLQGLKRMADAQSLQQHVYNFADDPLAAAISGMLHSRGRTGAYRQSGAEKTDDPGSMFCRLLGQNPYNLVHQADVTNLLTGMSPFRQVFHPVFQTDRLPDGALRALLERRGAHPTKAWIAMALSSPHESCRWSARAGSLLAYWLASKLNVNVFLLGDAAAVKQAEAMQSMHPHTHVINLCGALSLTETMALLKNLQCLIAVDNDTMRLAALLRAPVLLLAMGSCAFHRHGPYGKNVRVLTPNLACFPCPLDHRCNHRSCNQMFQPTTVFAHLLELLDMHAGQKNADQRLLAFRTLFKANNLLHYIPLNKIPLEAGELKALILQHAVEHFFKVGTISNHQDLKEIKRYYDLPFEPELIEALMAFRVRVANLLIHLRQTSADAGGRPVSGFSDQDFPAEIAFLAPMVRREAAGERNLKPPNACWNYTLDFLHILLVKLDRAVDFIKETIGIEI